MRWTTRNTLIAAAAVLLIGCAAFWLLRRTDRSQTSSATSAAAAQTIHSSGEIAGLKIGMSMADARQKLDPLRAPGQVYQPDAKEEQGRRILWRCAGTEYEWVMACAVEGNITRIRGYFRPEHRKPFQEIGDTSSALTADASMVRWNLQTAAGKPYRLTAQGAEHRASSVYMFLQELPSKEREGPADETVDEKQ